MIEVVLQWWPRIWSALARSARDSSIVSRDRTIISAVCQDAVAASSRLHASANCRDCSNGPLVMPGPLLETGLQKARPAPNNSPETAVSQPPVGLPSIKNLIHLGRRERGRRGAPRRADRFAAQGFMADTVCAAARARGE